MKIKVIALLCITMLLIAAFVGCGDKTDNGNNGSGDIISTETVKIENISDYTVVKSSDSSAEVKAAVKKMLDAIKDATSARLVDAVDSRKEAQYEIIIGNTKRQTDVDTSALNAAQFIIKKVGDKIVITGGSDMAVENGIKYFIENYISAENGVSVPGGEGVRIQASNLFAKLAITDKSLGEYVIAGNLYEIKAMYQTEGSTSVMESERVADFVAKLESASGISFITMTTEELADYEGNYILLDDTNSDFSSYEIKVENGNVILYANYYSLDNCINSFFTDFLGYDLEKGEIIGSKEINITQGKKYTVEKSAIYSKEKLYNLLETAYNNNDMLIVGQQMDQTVAIGEVFDWEIANYKAGCGVEPALLGWDVVGTMIYSQNQKSLESARVKIAYQLTEYMRSGGIVTLSPHYPNPLDENPEPGNSIKGELGHEDKWDELFTEGTDINTRFMGYLEQLGDFLEILDKNGAPIIFRNLLEMNGNWTWYGIGQTDETGVEKKIDAKYIKDLYILVYDYLVTERGLDNLIWLYAPNVTKRGGGSYTGDVMDCYPGDEYVDIIGVDWYPNAEEQMNPTKLLTSYEDLIKTGKLFVFGELSAGDNRTVGENYTFTTEDYDELLMNFLDQGVKMAYTLAWSSWDTSRGRVKLTMYEMGMGDRFYYNNDMYLDKSETYELLYK